MGLACYPPVARINRGLVVTVHSTYVKAKYYEYSTTIGVTIDDQRYRFESDNGGEATKSGDPAEVLYSPDALPSSLTTRADLAPDWWELWSFAAVVFGAYLAWCGVVGMLRSRHPKQDAFGRKI